MGVDDLRTLLLVAVIVAMMGGTLRAAVQWERSQHPASDEPMAQGPGFDEQGEAELGFVVGEPEVIRRVPVERAYDPALSVGIDLGEGAALFPRAEDVVLVGGLRLGPLVFGAEEAEVTTEEVASATAPTRRRARRTPVRPPGPRLHPDPGVHSVLTARRMMASGEVILGSCYKYLTEVYTRAGHRTWRNRRIVYRAEREGPYSDLSDVRPGDWLYIVNDPSRTPVGTHSVMFVRWTDRARGWASVISHPGWGARSAGRESTYDISRTYRIIRPTL